MMRATDETTGLWPAMAGVALSLLQLPIGALGPGAPREKLEIVTTLGVLAEVAREVGGEHVAVQALADPRQDPHVVRPTPTLMKRAFRADALVEIGLQLELWAQKVVDGSGNPGIQPGQPGRIVASRGISTLELPREISREWGDVHPNGNPHVWLDPIHVKAIAENVAEGLSRIDPAHAEEYRSAAADYGERIDRALFGEELLGRIGSAKLSRLARQGRLSDYLERRDLAGGLGGWLRRAQDLRGRKVVTYHKTWIYLGERFGFEIPVEIEEKPGIPPSGRHREHVLEVMRREGIHTILQAGFYDRTAADYLARETDACVVLVPLDVGSQGGAATYFELIDRILDALLAAEHGTD